MMTRLLIVNQQLVFAVTIKQALEQTGTFEVHAFTAADAALDYLPDHPQDVALVDFALGGRELVLALRAVQPDLAVIISPVPADAGRIQQTLNIQGMIDMPFTARKIMPLIEEAVRNRPQPFTDDTQALADTDEAPPARLSSRTQHLRELNEFFEHDRLERPGAADFEAGESQPPPDLPEFSSLGDVLDDEAPSEIFEPLIQEGDTPSVSTVDSNALRQFLATRGEEGQDFESILDGIDDPEALIQAASEGGDFAALVNSMRSENPHTPLPDRHQQFIEFILTGGMDTLLGEIEKAKTGPLEESPPAPDDSSRTFEKLAQEEPPMPPLEESGTVGDLMLGVSDTGFRNVLSMMRGEQPAAADEPERIPVDIEEAFSEFFKSQTRAEEGEGEESRDDMPVFDDVYRDEFTFEPAPPDKDSSIPAQVILETAMDESVPADSFSLEDLINSIDRQLSEYTPDIKPLPSWNVRFKPRPPRRPEERYIQEPDFLPEEFPTSSQQPVVEEVAPAPEIPPEPEMLPEAEMPPEADDFGATVLAPPSLPEEAEVQPIDDPSVFDWDAAPELSGLFDDMVVEEVPDEATVLLEQGWGDDAPVDFGSAADFDLPTESMDVLDDDPLIAQIALSLTQVSLELTAEATLLARHGEIVAVEGQLTPEDMADLRELLARGDLNEDESRISFITLASNSNRYMLYSRRTIGDFVLSMVFGADTPLRDIRRQGKRLMEALEVVPELPVPPVQTAEFEYEQPAAEPVDYGPLSPYAYIWLLRDPNRVLDSTVASAITAGLRTQLSEQGWQVRTLQARDEYVYLLADVPGERPAHEVIRDLKRRSAEIAQAQDYTLSPLALWADSYLVLTPGRELDPDEINQFINFERML